LLPTPGNLFLEKYPENETWQLNLPPPVECVLRRCDVSASLDAAAKSQSGHLNENAETNKSVGFGQGDQIGRVFVYIYVRWLFTLAVFENYRSSTENLGHFFHRTSYVSILTRHGLGYILGDFFTNSTGHPGLGESVKMRKLMKNPGFVTKPRLAPVNCK
jgi:hypothetical protein